MSEIERLEEEIVATRGALGQTTAALAERVGTTARRVRRVIPAIAVAIAATVAVAAVVAALVRRSRMGAHH